MAQQQELFLKLLNDRDTNNRLHETVDENAVAGSGGTRTGTSTEGVVTLAVTSPGKACALKTF